MVMIVVMITGVGGSLYYSSRTIQKMVDYSEIKDKNNAYTDQLNQFNEELVSIKQNVKGLLETEEEINYMIGRKKKTKEKVKR